MIRTRLERIIVGGHVFLSAGCAAVLVRFARTSLPADHTAWLRAFAYVLLAIIAIGGIALLVRRTSSRIAWEAVLAVASVAGVWYAAFLLPLSVGVCMLLAAVLTLVVVFVRIVAIHNLFVLVGSAGLAIACAMLFPWEVLVVGLVLFGIHDTVALASRGAAETLLTRMTYLTLVPGAIIPKDGRGRWLSGVDHALSGRATLLGVGDVICINAIVAWLAMGSVTRALLALGFLILGWGIALIRRDAPARTPILFMGAGAIVAALVVRLIFQAL